MNPTDFNSKIDEITKSLSIEHLEADQTLQGRKVSENVDQEFGDLIVSIGTYLVKHKNEISDKDQQALTFAIDKELTHIKTETTGIKGFFNIILARDVYYDLKNSEDYLLLLKKLIDQIRQAMPAKSSEATQPESSKSPTSEPPPERLQTSLPEMPHTESPKSPIPESPHTPETPSSSRPEPKAAFAPPPPPPPGKTSGPALSVAPKFVPRLSKDEPTPPPSSYPISPPKTGDIRKMRDEIALYVQKMNEALQPAQDILNLIAPIEQDKDKAKNEVAVYKKNRDYWVEKLAQFQNDDPIVLYELKRKDLPSLIIPLFSPEKAKELSDVYKQRGENEKAAFILKLIKPAAEQMINSKITNLTPEITDKENQIADYDKRLAVLTRQFKTLFLGSISPPDFLSEEAIKAEGKKYRTVEMVQKETNEIEQKDLKALREIVKKKIEEKDKWARALRNYDDKLAGKEHVDLEKAHEVHVEEADPERQVIEALFAEQNVKILMKGKNNPNILSQLIK